MIVYFTLLYFTTKHSIKAAKAFLFHHTLNITIISSFSMDNIVDEVFSVS